MKRELIALIISQFLDGWDIVDLSIHHAISKTELEQIIREYLNNGSK
jgi:hypothetical protein